MSRRRIEKRSKGMGERIKRLIKTMIVVIMCITMCIPQGIVYAAEQSEIKTVVLTRTVTRTKSRNTRTTKKKQNIRVAKTKFSVGDKNKSLKAKGKTTLKYTSSNKKIATVDSKGRITAKKAGKVQVTISARANSKYRAAKRKVTVEIVKKKQSITAKNRTLFAGEKNIKLGAKAKSKLTYKSLNANVVTVNSKGEVTAKRSGTARIEINAKTTKAYKKASKVITITVKQKPKVNTTTIKDLRGKEGKLTVSVNKVDGVSGYQIRYATNEKMKGAKIKDISKSGKSTFNITPSEYYVQVRSYINANGRKHYSSWGTWGEMTQNPAYVMVLKTYKIDIGKGRSEEIQGFWLIDEAEEIVKLTNEYRKKKGKSTLKRRDDLTNTASLRAREAAIKFAHQRPNGTSSTTAFPKTMKSSGENLGGALGGPSTAKKQLDRWINSPAHNTNMLNASWNCMGAAVFVKAEWMPSWNDYYIGDKYSVQCFGRM